MKGYLLLLLLLCIALGAYMLTETTTRKLDTAEVWRWCSQIEREKRSTPPGSSAFYDIRAETVYEFLEACKKTHVTCKRIQTVKRERQHHGGNFYITLEEVNVVF